MIDYIILALIAIATVVVYKREKRAEEERQEMLRIAYLTLKGFTLFEEEEEKINGKDKRYYH